MSHTIVPTSLAPDGAPAPSDEPRDAMTLRPPRVSIGLPVFDGERYLARAIDSVLGQDVRDLELIVCDNASTDRTPEICEEYARRDLRVRYFRNERNLGAGPNYDRCFHLARGAYFKWMAHDDRLAPGYLSRAVAALDAAPGAVLCTTGVAEIGPDDGVRRVYRNVFPGIGSPSPARRLAAVIHTRHECEDFFGLFRREALLGSSLHGTHGGSDRVLLAEMALRGPWVGVPEPLFLHREHKERYTRAVLLAGDLSRAALWLDTSAPAARASRMFHSWSIGTTCGSCARTPGPAGPAWRATPSCSAGGPRTGTCRTCCGTASRASRGCGGCCAPRRPSCPAPAPPHEAARPVRSTRRGGKAPAGRDGPATQGGASAPIERRR